MAEEIQRLREALRDLVAISTIPAVWVGRDPPAIAAGLADLVVGVLNLDSAFVRLRDPNDGTTIEITRGHSGKAFVDGNGDPGVVVPVGVASDGGLLAASCSRADFPTEVDRLILSVAANHAAIAFYNSRLVYERLRAEEALRRAHDELEATVTERTGELRRINTELAHATRVGTLGELAASIAHEINQPLAAIGANASASLSWLAHPDVDLGRIRDAVSDIVADGRRAGEVIQRLRQLATKSDPKMSPVDMNDVIGGAVGLVRSEVQKHRAVLRMTLSPVVPPALGDRVQLQQVMINLMMNAVEAMEAVKDRPRELVVRSEAGDGREVVVAVQDSGVGIDPNHVERLFDAFFTTKSTGMGMGLSISRTIIAGHGGRLWATQNPTHGATFRFSLPALI